MSFTPESLSARKVAQVLADVSTPPVVTHGTFAYLSWAGATILKGTDYRPGQDLDVTVDGTDVAFPDDDSGYDIQLSIVATCDAADNGKLVGCFYQGNDYNQRDFQPVVSGELVFAFAATDNSWPGDAATFSVKFDARALSVDMTITNAYVCIVRRP